MHTLNQNEPRMPSTPSRTQHSLRGYDPGVSRGSGGQHEPDDRKVLGLFNVRGTLAVGLAFSISLHLLLLVLAALVLVSTGGTPGEGDRPPGEVELAVVTSNELRAMQSDASLPTVPVPKFEQPETEAMESIELAELDTSRSDVSLSERAVEGLGAGDLTSGSELATGGGGEGSVSFFGAEAVGRRIAYVIDMSGSMASGGKIEAVQTELGRSLGELRPQMEFFVGLYNSTGFPLPGFERWTQATPALTREARRAFVHRSSEIGGSTFPVFAFELVFKLRPLPDAIFFMTDGEFSDQDQSMEQIIAMNSSHKIPIHCLTFIDQSAEARMRHIAEVSGGTYTHIDGLTPRRRR